MGGGGGYEWVSTIVGGDAAFGTSIDNEVGIQRNVNGAS